MENTMNITKKQFAQIVKESVSKSEVCRKLGIAGNGTGLRKVTKLSKQYSVDISHFSQRAAMTKFTSKYKVITKPCPVCGKEFETKKGHRREKTTCSHSCSNTHFAEKRNIPSRYKNYKTICFKKWPKKCLVCGYDRSIHVHHLNGNHADNTVQNLIPLCANHHEEIHSSKYFDEVAQVLFTTHQLVAVKKIKGTPKNFKVNQKYDWPSKEEIIKSGIDVVAKHLGVPKSYVRKHLLKVGISISE